MNYSTLFAGLTIFVIARIADTITTLIFMRLGATEMNVVVGNNKYKETRLIPLSVIQFEILLGVSCISMDAFLFLAGLLSGGAIVAVGINASHIGYLLREKEKGLKK